jgi:hypothetical protein
MCAEARAAYASRNTKHSYTDRNKNKRRMDRPAPVPDLSSMVRSVCLHLADDVVGLHERWVGKSAIFFDFVD